MEVVKISEVGLGGPALNVGDTIFVNFNFTLAETTPELFPDLDKRMPGLNVGDSFEARLRVISSEPAIKRYSINYYSKL